MCIIALRQISKTKWYYKYWLLLLWRHYSYTDHSYNRTAQHTSLCDFLVAWLFFKSGREFRGGLVLSLLLIKPHFSFAFSDNACPAKK